MAKKKTKIKSNEHIYKKGEDLGKIAKELSGHSYNIYALLLRSGKTIESLQEGDVLKWE